MEGKELPNEDDKRKSGSENSHEESDDFGLPDASFGEESDESDESSEAEESTESTPYEYTVGEDSEPSAYEETPEEPAQSDYAYSSSDDEDEGRSTPVGLIVFLSLVGVIVVALAVYWFFFRSPAEEEVVEEPVAVVTEDTTAVEPVIEEPEPVEEEVMETPPPEPEVGNYETINTRTGRYYIVLNSFFDEDLAVDYAKRLADQGVSTVILGASERGSFKRVALQEDFGGWSVAESRMNELKGTYGQDIWVLKY